MLRLLGSEPHADAPADQPVGRGVESLVDFHMIIGPDLAVFHSEYSNDVPGNGAREVCSILLEQLPAGAQALADKRMPPSTGVLIGRLA